MGCRYDRRGLCVAKLLVASNFNSQAAHATQEGQTLEASAALLAAPNWMRQLPPAILRGHDCTGKESKSLAVSIFREATIKMPDHSEILLEEIAILRQEIADVRGALENLDQLVRGLNVTLLQCANQLTMLTEKMHSPLTN
jgi:hypothetical protein